LATVTVWEMATARLPDSQGDGGGVARIDAVADGVREGVAAVETVVRGVGDVGAVPERMPLAGFWEIA